MIPAKKRYRPFWRFLRYCTAFLVFIFCFFLLLVNKYLEPVLRDRLHTLIITGSDSLYQYSLGSLKASFFGGNVEVDNLHIWVDSNRYQTMLRNNALPTLTMQLDLYSGQIKGIGILPLIFGRRITVKEIVSKNADIKLTRHARETNEPKRSIPLWQAMQPHIKSIAVGKINVDGIKMLYTDADTTQSVQLAFDKCVAQLNNIKIDSAAAADTSRIAFTKSVNMQFDQLKFRTPDSTYKMQAASIRYSSTERIFEVHHFKMQPTLAGDDFYHRIGYQQAMYTIL